MPVLRLPKDEIYYETAGSGSPALVFIHGYTCDHTDWEFQVKHFAATNRVVALDLRGHGSSTRNDPDCSIESLARDTGSLIEALDIDRAVLIGHSMGCRVAFETYVQNKGPVRGIVFIDGSRMGSGDPGEVAKTVRQTIEKSGFQAYARGNFAGMFFDDANAALKVRLIERAAGMEPEFGTRLRCAFPGWDAAKMESALSEIKVPLLLIQSTGIDASGKRYSLKTGENTPWFDLVRKHVKNARIEVIPGRGHFVMLEAPDATNRLVASFVAQLKK